MTEKSKYKLDAKGSFCIENYNQSKAFSNFFPGIAGIWGIPMWAFYVNRGQCIASFGIESKDKAIMEFQPANKSYRLTATQGFRTFLKIKSGSKTLYWEPFQNNMKGSEYKSKQKMYITAHDLTLEDINEDLGLTVQVNYFTMPEEPYSGLVRHVTVTNKSKKKYSIELIDGMPIIIPYGINDGLNKNIARTIEAWVKVRNLENKAPYYQLNVEVSDTPQVTHVKEGNFFFSFDPDEKNISLKEPIVESSKVFGSSLDFQYPEAFMDVAKYEIKNQQTDNRTPCAMSFSSFDLKPKGRKQLYSVFGFAHQQNHLKDIVLNATKPKFLKDKCNRNKEIIDQVKNYSLTKSSSEAFNFYTGATFLDNILRGGLPVSLKTSDGFKAFNVYSRKHGDLERDYNYFFVSPTFFSQGNGNYRDVNQNRRNDVWFNSDVKESHLINFLNLSQADGYNPLVVKGTAFKVTHKKDLKALLDDCVEKNSQKQLEDILSQDFLPGNLLQFINLNEIKLKTKIYDFLGRVIEISHRLEQAEHGEGFWSDHWHYNLDLLESYLALYPEDLEKMLHQKKVFHFYHNTHYVQPRDQRYVLTDQGVRQYDSVRDTDIQFNDADGSTSLLKTKNGQGAVYQTNLMVKLLCLIANKVSTLDPSGVGVEMEADKPNWYDALNGLPGLIGSSISETYELKRFATFLLESIKQLGLKDNDECEIFEELATFINGIKNVLSVDHDALSYWIMSNDIKEHYRQRILIGIDGKEVALKIVEIKSFLELVIKKTNKATEAARNKDGFLSTYFYHDVEKFEKGDKFNKVGLPLVTPKAFKRHDLPLFLEGYVHALRTEKVENAKQLYSQVIKSPLFDKKLKMYKVNTCLDGETEEIGRTRIFPSSWLENESIWLHMEYKFILELLRTELYDEFYENFKNVFIPFLKPEQYGRSILENSSFIVSSSHNDETLHGQGFVARLSGSTAEFLNIWLWMCAGKKPFVLNGKKELVLAFEPILKEWLFTNKKSNFTYFNRENESINISLPTNVFAFNFLGSIPVIYHNPKRKDTFGSKKAQIKKIDLTYPQKKKPVTINSQIIPEPYSQDIRSNAVERIDIYLN